MKVGEAMTGKVRTCERGHTLDMVMRKMWEHDLGALPVVNEAGQPIAMITDRDIAVAAYTQGRPLSQIQVQSAMSQELTTTHVSDTLSAAEKLLRAHQLHRLPVVDESTRLVGILSLNDIARMRSRAAQARAGEQASHDLAATLTAIAQRRRAPSAPDIAQDDGERSEEPRRPSQVDTTRSQAQRPAAPRASGLRAGH
jgi:CBS domain-containing protein